MNLGATIRVGIATLILGVATALPLQITAPPRVQQSPKTTRTTLTIAKPRPLATTQVGTGLQIDFNWQYTANLPVCTSTLQACYDGFQLTDTTTGVMIGGVGTNSPIGPTALSFNWAPAGGVPYGTQTFSLVAHGYDENGNPVVSSSATCTVVVPVTSLNGPTGLTGVTGALQ